MIRELIYSDLYRYIGKRSFYLLIKSLKNSPGFRYTFFLRIQAHFGRRSFIGFFSYLFYRKYCFKYQIQIPPTVKIGKGFMMPHFGGIVVNSKSVIGNNCNILQNVTIGRTNRGRLNGAPVIGNQVYIGPGAVIVGKVLIGDNVLIAPNSYVNFDVPKNSIVLGNPAKILPNDNAVMGYISNVV
ncbi:serine acetyltransferase [Mucilaginibacter sabulilitoris]|uniref:Serine acetyltransferase n=1 Tax=Mucilaginibacter sabulilitoris TaxID=1173583 RepID=A0ABZ0TV02_9SPHI|nr:serine acetyltransferase [Mucilaginibacter sabulilitoris]WPU95614.1 serine acetyltransferase [Mucilaginibacter sabulilitoris]